MKSAKENKELNYESSYNCYIEVGNDGSIREFIPEFNKPTAEYENARNGRSRIFVVNPKFEYSYARDTDIKFAGYELYIVDDLDAYADAFCIPRPDDHVHNITWKLHERDDGKGQNARIVIFFACGCELRSNNFKKFAKDMEKQKSWEIRLKSWPCRTMDKKGYEIEVRRKSLQ